MNKINTWKGLSYYRTCLEEWGLAQMFVQLIASPLQGQQIPHPMTPWELVNQKTIEQKLARTLDLINSNSRFSYSLQKPKASMRNFNMWNDQNVPMRWGARPYQQWSEDLSQGVRIQVIAGLRLGHLGQVCEEILQGEAMMERYSGGVLENQANLSVMASSECTI